MAKYGRKASTKVEKAMHERKKETLKSGRSWKRKKRGDAKTGTRQRVAAGHRSAKKVARKSAKKVGKKSPRKLATKFGRNELWR